jgi:hypothetical protein
MIIPRSAPTNHANERQALILGHGEQHHSRHHHHHSGYLGAIRDAAEDVLDSAEESFRTFTSHSQSNHHPEDAVADAGIDKEGAVAGVEQKKRLQQASADAAGLNTMTGLSAHGVPGYLYTLTAYASSSQAWPFVP